MPKAKAGARQSVAERWSPQERRQQLIRVASRLIAERGIEALRTRDIAALANINIATLHYHFSTKDALIQAVVSDLIDQFRTARSAPRGAELSALEQFRLEMQDVRTRMVSAPEQLSVLTEFAIHARRDPRMAKIVQRMDQGWHRQLSSILQHGKDTHAFRPDLEVSSAASAIMAQLRGLGLVGGSASSTALRIFDQWQAQIEAWLTCA